MIGEARLSEAKKSVPHESRQYERQVLRYVEAELYAYPWRKQDIERVRADILASTPERAVTFSEQVSNPTLLKAMQLLTSRRLERLVQNYDAITKVYESLDKTRKHLIEMRYWQREYTDYGIYKKLFISRRTYFYWREQALRLMAVEMGLL